MGGSKGRTRRRDRGPGPSPITFNPSPFPGQPRPFAVDPATRTAGVLRTLFAAEEAYQNRHRLAAPASLDALAAAVGWARSPASPFDPSSSEPGYVFLPDNVVAPPPRVMFYDAAELRLSRRTHVIYRPGRRIVVLTRDQLTQEPGVTLP